MNTNGNTYTVIYTTIIVVVVAAILAFASLSLKPRQKANEQAETISQILTAAQFGTKDELTKQGNAAVIKMFEEELAEAYTVNENGEKVADLKLDATCAEVAEEGALKAQNYKIRDGKDEALPVYVFKNGITVLPIYGAGLWGPVWGYIALEKDLKTIKGAYFDHESETPGLGGKIKEAPFQSEFPGKSIDFTDEKGIFQIVKGGAPEGKANAIDAISGATMTSKGVNKAINTWLAAYKPFLEGSTAAEETVSEEEEAVPAELVDSTAVEKADSAAVLE
jgi:Na+-transporting NADH:ubiquinone oxidoreductase subunit C